MTDINELVEWVASKVWLWHINHARLSNLAIPEYDESDFRKQVYINHQTFIDCAKQILSHPDLFTKVACQTCRGSTYVNYNLATCPDCTNGYDVVKKPKQSKLWRRN